MTTASVFAAARHVLRVQRRQRAIVIAGRRLDERRTPVQWVGLFSYFALIAAIPLLVPCVAWMKSHAASELSSVRWGIGGSLAVMLVSGHLFQQSALSFGAREVLFLPDKASVLLVRLLRALPVLMWIGGAWALASWFCLRDEWQQQPAAVAALCAVAALAPVARSVAVLLQRLVAPDAGSVLTPAILVALAATYLFRQAQWRGDVESVTLSWLVLAFAAIPLVGLLHGLKSSTRGTIREAWIDLVNAPRAIVIAVLLLPPAVWRESAWLPIVACAGGVSIVLLLPLALRSVLRAVNSAEADTPRAAIERALGREVLPTAVRARPIAPPPHHGRSLWRATWRLHWLQHGITRRDLRRPMAVIGFLVRHGVGIAVAGVLAWADRSSQVIPAAFVFGMIVGPVRSPNISRERLLMLGVDLREQLHQQVVLVLWSAALPALLSATLVARSSGWNEGRALVLAALAAGFLLRVGWRGLMPRPESASSGVAGLFLLLWVAVDVVARTWPVPRPGADAELFARALSEGRSEPMLQTSILQWPIVGAFAALALVGFVRRVVLWREPELLADLIAARERESRPAA